MSFRNMEAFSPGKLDALIDAASGQVSSMALLSASPTDATLFAFSSGESVSEEMYFSDTLYFCLDGSLEIVSDDTVITLGQNEAVLIPTGTQHAIRGSNGCAFKMLQINA